ncbi:MAG: orotidine-5'-phosphate decarboxylase, partial [Deltaproteobacteria bacterium]|nr:orotidine-5'-phosphate decarboxylase [Deltaproteobacteria bacterium]
MAEGNRIIFALDVGDKASALEWIEKLSGRVGYFKVGLELYTALGPQIVHEIKHGGLRCFLDLKFHDIPNTVAGAVRSATRLGVDMMTVHISGGAAMLKAAMDAAVSEAQLLGIARPKIIGVSVLTSLDERALNQIGIMHTPAKQVE